MELIDVNTQDFQYLTLSQYNGEKKYVRARCEMRKDEPFLQDTSNAFVCVESFRLSCAPNEGGIVYRNLPNTYAIQVEKDEPSQDNTVDTKALLKTELGYFILSDANAQQMRFLPSKTKIGATLSINKIIEGMVEDLNPVCVNKGTVMDVAWEDTDQKADVTLLDDPIANIRGPGMGPHGILPCYCRFMRNSSYIKGRYTPNGAMHPNPTSREPDKYQWAQVRINKDDVPNMKITDLAIYLSSKVNLYRADFAGTRTDAYFQVLGPMFMKTDTEQQTEQSLIAGDSGATFYSPVFQLYCKDTLYKDGGTVFMDSVNDDNKRVTVSAKITYLPKWYDDKGDHYMFYLSGIPTVDAQQDLDRSAGRQLWSDSGAGADNGADDFNFYYIYNQQYMMDTELFNLIQTASSIHTENTQNQINGKSEATYKTEIKSRVVTTRRPTIGDPIPCFTPLDMFEKFNTGWKDSAPIQMMTDPNGGFRITVLEDGISTLRVSQQMLYDMGLNTYLTQEGVVNQEPETYEYKVVVLEVHRVTDDTDIPIYKWQTDYSNPQPLQSYLGIGDIHEFVIMNPATGQETGPLRHDTVLPCTVIQTTSGKFYKVIAINYQKITNTNIANQHYEGRAFTAQDGLEFIEWKTPMKGAYIGNDNTVSIGSFSIYENIRLVATGFGFQPFIVARADQPVLCELRLPYGNQMSLASGAGANQLTITNTTSEFYGDIIYEAPASGHQYLRLNSQTPVYDITVEPRLIPRDPDLPQERVMLGFSDVFQVKLRFLMRN